MEYSIQALSRLSGVTTRTLRWYDQIGLLKPARVAETGYRYYGPAEVDRLRDILYYRALGVELARIKECLDDPSFDRLTALRGHLDALRARQSQLDSLIRSVQDAIRCEERNEMMSDQEKFEAFKTQTMARYEAAYGDEARQTYGDEPVQQARQPFLICRGNSAGNGRGWARTSGGGWRTPCGAACRPAARKAGKSPPCTAAGSR